MRIPKAMLNNHNADDPSCIKRCGSVPISPKKTNKIGTAVATVTTSESTIIANNLLPKLPYSKEPALIAGAEDAGGVVDDACREIADPDIDSCPNADKSAWHFEHCSVPLFE